MARRLLRYAKHRMLEAELELAKKNYWLRPWIRLPDFMGIGSPQSATTWLAGNLDQHPEVAVSQEKETHFFSRNIWRGLSWYSEQFDKEAMIVGEFTPSYGRLPIGRIRLIHDLVPHCRLLLTIRHPVDRAWAAARRTMSMMARHWKCTLEEMPKSEFLEYFKTEEEYNLILLGRDGLYEPGLKSGSYSAIIDNWTSVFPEDQLLVVFFDDIKRDPTGELRRAFEHIGASTAIDFDRFSTTPKNSNRPVDMPDWAREALEHQYAGEIERLRERLGRLPAEWK